MTFPATLRPAARSAYRAVLRSARLTFHGDPVRHAQMLAVVRETFQSPTLTAPTLNSAAPKKPSLEDAEPVDPASPDELAKRVNEWIEVAAFLRRNVVQGELDEKKGTYKLRVTADTELGDNETIKAPPVLPVTPFPNRNRRRRRQAQADAAAEGQQTCGGN